MLMKKKLKLKNKLIPVNHPIITSSDIDSVKKCLHSNWISGDSPVVKKFEKEFSYKHNKKYGVAVSNGTAALEIAIKSLNLKKNNEIIIPNFSIISTALAVIKNNLKPVLVDVDLSNWNMSVDQIIKKINNKTKAILITHIYGYPVEMEKVLKIAKEKKILIIEDAAEMIGQKYKNKLCGSFGDISTFSFYANKHITTGEGGMILTNNKNFYIKSQSLRNLCFGNSMNRFNHNDIGWNYRLSSMQAALGLSQLKRLSSIVKRKKQIGKLYYSLLKNNNFIQIQKPSNKYSENIFWVFGIIIKPNKKFTRDFVAKELIKKKIQTRNFFFPMNRQKIFKKLKIFNNSKFPNSDFLSKYGLYLPSGLSLTNSEIKYVCKNINSIFSQ